jgi:hypothetical protein
LCAKVIRRLGYSVHVFTYGTVDLCTDMPLVDEMIDEVAKCTTDGQVVVLISCVWSHGPSTE